MAMTVEIEEILAWVDGNLNEQRANEVESAVLADPQLQRTAEAMRASQLPYSDAYDKASMSEVPDSLRVKVAVLRDSALDIGNPDNRPDENHLPNGLSVGNEHRVNYDRRKSNERHIDVGAAKTPLNRSTSRANSRARKDIDVNNGVKTKPFFQIAGIAAGLMAVGVLGFLVGSHIDKEPTVTDAIAAHDAWNSENFARIVASYQAFYTRDTVWGSDTSPEKIAAVTERLVEQTGMDFDIPELEGYKFVRAQHLAYSNQPLVQLVYIGEEGGPLALCFMPAENSEAQKVVLENHHGLNTAEWAANGRRVVIVSDLPQEKLNELYEDKRLASVDAVGGYELMIAKTVRRLAKDEKEFLKLINRN